MGNTTSPRICSNCGTINAPGDEFCANCGFSLDAQTGAATIQGVPPTIAATRRVTGGLTNGILLAGRYRVVKLIGKGGFGAVYEASDTHFQGKHSVAIKEMSDAQLSPQEKASAVQDFRNEADLLIRLKHPNLPNVSDFFEEDNKVYLVMEFIEGKTLEDIQSEKKGPLDERLVMSWAVQLCTVLNYLHTRPQPIIFRDMKPSNVMLTDEGEIKLIDFGIARIFKTTASRDTTLLGSRGYAPVEQHGRGQSDTRSDIYALGATLFDLLTHELPTDSITRMVNPTLFVPPRQLNPALSPATESIVLKAMEINAQDRYQSVREMAQAIIASGIATVDTSALSISGAIANMATAPTTTSQSQASTIAPQPAPRVKQQPQQQQMATQTVSAPGSTALAPSRISRRAVIAGGVVALGALAVGGTTILLNNQKKSIPVAAPVTPGGTLMMNFIYSTEKESWMKKAISDFNASNQKAGNKVIQIQGSSQGSVDAKDQILKGSLKPVAWSPASFLELNQLNTAWNTQHGQNITYSSGDYIAKSLVFTPIVFAVWKERAALLLKKYGSIDWQSIHKAILLKSWSDIGGQSDWGQVKLGQTRPDESNSGLLSITLMAYAFYNTQRGLTTNQIIDGKFQQFFQDIESAVQTFGRSSGTYLVNEVIARGPASYDIIPIYENLILANEDAAKKQGQILQPIYPDLNILSDHPFAIFNGSWVKDEEKQAAQKFRDFLLSDQQQRNALLSGFRPAAGNIDIMEPIEGNPFKAHATDFTIPPAIQKLAQPPSGNVINELLNQWTKQYGSAPSALSQLPPNVRKIM
ncbi:hypothetical protein KDA_29160 [Dictyobacter alpinus]|uniref:non-specific serine/threonine protein kinase n=1 Tax=Dictyobacter alpinus TaxID=2014873 RepID=A0A402B7Z2_9CHLR|nr:serine/threonine-protein kinase [Dictyobacter alpinus]GCE27432.1 hypothetical protein KDA_29160 [Dictyobacter alpinus]